MCFMYVCVHVHVFSVCVEQNKRENLIKEEY